MKFMKIFTISVTTALFLNASNVPNISNIEKEILSTKKDTTEKKDTVEISGLDKYTPAMNINKSSTKKILVKSFEIDGAIHVDKNELLESITPYTNKELTFYQLKLITDILTKKYRDKGYFVARAYLPVQNIQNGNVTIAIIEGQYDKFKLVNNSKTKDSYLQAIIDNTSQKDRVISSNTIQRTMYLINDTPGVIIKQTQIEPGSEVGTSDFTFTTETSKNYNAYIIGDNYGSKYTGKNRLMAGASVNSPLKIGDKLSIGGLISNGENLKNGEASYMLPLNASGLKGELSYSKTNYSLDKEYKNLDAVGNSQRVGTKFSYPIIRSKFQNLYSIVDLSAKDLEDDIRATSNKTSKNSKSAKFSLDYDKNDTIFGLNTKDTASIGYTIGKLEFDDKAKDLGDTSGNYSKIELALSKNTQLTTNTYFNLSGKYQHSLNNKNLDGSEDFTATGIGGVIFYPVSESSAENGYSASAEVKYVLPSLGKLNNTVTVFYDIGRVYMAKKTTNENNRTLADVGIGYYTSYKSFFAKAQITWKANDKDVTSEPDYNSRFLFQAGWVY